MIRFEHEDSTILNPFLSECGRFAVAPEQYGFTKAARGEPGDLMRHVTGVGTIYLATIDQGRPMAADNARMIFISPEGDFLREESVPDEAEVERLNNARFLLTHGPGYVKQGGQVVDCSFFGGENGYGEEDYFKFCSLQPGQIDSSDPWHIVTALPDDWQTVGYRGEFPDYDDCLPEMHPLVDVSWHNDIAPSFCLGEADQSVRLWCEYKDPALREMKGAPRFTVTDSLRPEAGILVQGETIADLSENIHRWFADNGLPDPAEPMFGHLISGMLKAYENMPKPSVAAKPARGPGM